MASNSKINWFTTYEITGKYPGPHVLFMGGIHGDEFEPMLTCMSLAQELPEKLIKGRVTIIPVSNPGAYKLGERCSSDKKDLARTFPGKPSGTYTERLAHDLTQIIKSADYLIDLHTGGTLFDILPFCGYMLHQNKAVLTEQRKMALAFGMPLIWGTEAQAQGRTLSAARDLNIPAIYAECRGGLEVSRTTITLYERSCLNVLNYLGMIKIREKMKKDPAWVEDHTPGEGHLQSKMPSPAAGIFVPVVSLGQRIKKGDVIGCIADPITNKKIEVKATNNGVLFMLRISARVAVGDSLGGILPVSPSGKKIVYAK
jgi:predicted deacylase